jgi:hypothetical protein
MDVSPLQVAGRDGGLDAVTIGGGRREGGRPRSWAWAGEAKVGGRREGERPKRRLPTEKGMRATTGRRRVTDGVLLLRGEDSQYFTATIRHTQRLTTVK